MFVRTERATQNPHVLVVTIDRPPVNAASLETYQELIALFEGLESDSKTRCVILTGAGEKAFIAGSDVGELGALNPESALTRARSARRVFDLIRTAPVPVVAAVNGYALGSGLVIASVCDIIIAAAGAQFSLPEINVRVMGATKHLARIVPEKMMRYMALTGRRVSAETLLRIGSVQEVVPKEMLMTSAMAIAQEIAEKSPTGVRLMKEVINLIEPMALNDGYHVETFATAIISAHPDSKEAARAFREKRPASYGS